MLKVVKSSAAKVEPLPLVGEGSDNYAGDEMVTKVVPYVMCRYASWHRFCAR